MSSLAPTLPAPRMRDSIRRVFDRATDEVLALGCDWYRATGNEIANEGRAFGVDRNVSIGVFAAFSCHAPLNRNWIYFRAALEGDVSGHYEHVLDKVERMLTFPGESPENVLSGPKIGAFYSCLSDPADSSAVCVDTHAARIALAEMGETPKRVLNWVGGYTAIADCYRHVAADVGLLPQQLQAVTWLQHRRDNGKDWNGE